MSRIGLAFSSFFRLLFGKKLSPAVADYLPPEVARLPAGDAPPPKAAKPEPKPEAKPPEAKPEPKPEPVAKKVDLSAAQRDGALALLALLQRDGRLVDFLREPLDGFADADIGAAARDVHRGCKKVLDQYFTLEPVLPGADDAKVTVPKGFDPAEIRVIGEAKGEPPFAGALRHHGWRAAKAQLPTLADGVDRAIVAPAEVELS
jgi:hypothetical protein